MILVHVHVLVHVGGGASQRDDLVYLLHVHVGRASHVPYYYSLERVPTCRYVPYYVVRS